jgi:hypothetical protein
MNTTFNSFVLILTWYALVGGFVAFFLFLFNLVNKPRWRDVHGDSTSEAGYFEDATGRVLPEPGDPESPEKGDFSPPHVQA